MSDHDTYVWQEGRRWFWRCSTCRETNGTPGYRRRMDADDAESDHWDGPVVGRASEYGLIGQHAQLDPDAEPSA